MNVPKVTTLAENVLVVAGGEVTSGFSTGATYNRETGIVGAQIVATFQGTSPTPGTITVTLGLALEESGPFYPLDAITVPPPASGATSTMIAPIDARHANYITVLKVANGSAVSDAVVTIVSTL